MGWLTNESVARILCAVAPAIAVFSMAGPAAADMGTAPGADACAWIQDPDQDESGQGDAEPSTPATSTQDEDKLQFAAGYDGNAFYVGTTDGKYTMRFNGLFQLRAVGTFRGSETGRASASPDDDNELGFEFRRIELGIAGNIHDLGYQLVLATEDGAAGVEQIIAQDVKVDYPISDEVKIGGGRYFAPFLREELMGGGGSLAVALSFMNNSLSVGRAEGVSLLYQTDDFRADVFINDGAGSGGGGGVNSPFADGVDWALTTRADIKLAGDWGQWGDFTAGSEDSPATFLGFAAHYQKGESGDSDPANDVDKFMWTIDGSAEWGGLNAFAAVAGHHTNPGTGSSLGDYGAVAQIGYMAVPDRVETFFRWEFMSFDNNRNFVDDDVHLLTVGANYHFNSKAKFGLDAIWAMDAIPMDSPNAGILADGVEDGQIVLRAQLQLKL